MGCEILAGQGRHLWRSLVGRGEPENAARGVAARQDLLEDTESDGALPRPDYETSQRVIFLLTLARTLSRITNYVIGWLQHVELSVRLWCPLKANSGQARECSYAAATSQSLVAGIYIG